MGYGSRTPRSRTRPSIARASRWPRRRLHGTGSTRNAASRDSPTRSRPGGWWAGWWNVFHDPAGEPDALFEALDPILPSPKSAVDSTQHTGAEEFILARQARFDDLRASGFDDVELHELRWVLALDPQRARALFGTFSPVLALPSDERERILGEVEAVIAERFDGLFERRCVTILYTALRI